MKKAISIVLVSLVLILSLAGCGKSGNALSGKWAYNHDESTVILNLKTSGKAVFEGIEYTYTTDDAFITLTDQKGNVSKMRYVLDKDNLLLYKTTVYVKSEGDSSSLIGLWNGKEVGNWSFEFNEQGEFKEDGYFPGYYTVDEKTQSIKLVYNDQFYDTTIYYSLSNGELTIEYPWTMVKVK